MTEEKALVNESVDDKRCNRGNKYRPLFEGKIQNK